MKHFNNSIDRNVNLSNMPEFESDYSPRSKKTEQFFVILLIIVGISGALYTFNFGFQSSLSKANRITKNLSSPAFQVNTNSVVLHKNTPEKRTAQTQVLIVGEKEANQKIEFTIESFDNKARYDLNMGNGVILHPTESSIVYKYPKPGNYQVELEVSYNGKSERIFTEDIEILESIAVAPKAHQEY